MAMSHVYVGRHVCANILQTLFPFAVLNRKCNMRVTQYNIALK